MTVTSNGFGATDLVGRALAAGEPTMLYQPLVDLRRAGTPVVGYEALARWPTLGEPATGALFESATNDPRLAELDRRCRGAALRGALNAGLDRRTALFVNVEPVGRVAPSAPEGRLWALASSRLTVVLEVTERRILTAPADLFASVRDARRAGLLIALDDVGVNADSLAILEFVRPDVVKLDMSIVQERLAGDRARTMFAVSAYCERSGAALVAEGIETPEQAAWARSLGAGLGQGFRFGRPGPLRPGAATFEVPGVQHRVPPESPFELLDSQVGSHRVGRAAVNALLADMERQAATLPDPPVVLAAVRHADRFGPDERRTYADLARSSPLVAVFGVGMPARPTPGVVGVPLRPEDPLGQEWVLVVTGPHLSLALAAREVLEQADGAPEPHRRFRYAVSADRELVTLLGAALLERMAPTPR